MTTEIASRIIAMFPVNVLSNHESPQFWTESEEFGFSAGTDGLVCMLDADGCPANKVVDADQFAHLVDVHGVEGAWDLLNR